MPVVEIPLGEWMPDAPSFKNPGCVVADNVIPQTGGYGPLPSLVSQSEFASGAVVGARQMFDNSGSSLIVGGTDDALFVRRGAFTETAGLSSLGTGEAWDFAQFNNFVIATAANNNPQYLTNIDSDNTFSDLTGSPPVAKRCAKVSDFLMLGNIAGAPNRIQWSALNSPTGSWAADRLTQAGSLDLPVEYGEVQRIVGGRYALVFQKRGIHRLSYVGPPAVWRADVISDERGAVAPWSVVTVGSITFFFAQDGWYLTNGAEVRPIGQRRVNEWFLANVSQGEIANIQGAIDWQNESIVWAFTDATADSYNRLLIYSWAQDRWSTASIPVGWLVGSIADGVSLDSLDAIYGNLDNIPLSLDDPSFKQGARVLSAFVDAGDAGSFNADFSNDFNNGDGGESEYHLFNGEPAEATWQTGEFQPSPARRVHISEVFPLMEAEEWNMTAQLTTRDNRGQVTGSSVGAAGWSGFCPVRGEGQKASVTLTKPQGNWTAAQGIQVRYRPAGYR